MHKLIYKNKIKTVKQLAQRKHVVLLVLETSVLYDFVCVSTAIGLQELNCLAYDQ